MPSRAQTVEAAMVKTGSKSQLIVRAPGIHGGEPVVQGTRVPVRSIVLSLENDYPGDLAAVAHAYSVDVAAVEAALAYYKKHKAEIDEKIERNERAAYDV